MCFPCWPVKDIVLEGDDEHNQRERQTFQYIWNGQQWVPRVGNTVSGRVSLFLIKAWNHAALSPDACEAAHVSIALPSGHCVSVIKGGRIKPPRFLADLFVSARTAGPQVSI